MHCRPSFTRSFRSSAASVAASVAHASMLIASLAPLAGCGGVAGSDVDAASPPIDAPFASLDAGSGVTSDAGTSAHLDAASVSSDAASSHDAFAPPSRDLRCGDAIPEGAEVAPPLPAYSGGTCPAIAPGRNTIRSGGVDREFVVVVPSDFDPSERLPVVFMWHWLQGSADSMVMHGQAQESANALRFVAVVPESRGDLAIRVPFAGEFDPQWPYLESASDARVEQEAVFFDDMLACVSAAYAIDDNCVSSVGVSAGALWNAQLVQRRGERLANAIIMSGGIGPATSGLGASLGLEVRDWSGTDHRMPILLGWGGPSDQCGLAFERASMNLETHLDGHFVLECVHNCGHTVPPVDPAAGLRALWGFALDHPYWLRDGESRYLTATGLPSDVPGWCAIGIGNATPRTGECMPIEGAGGLSSCPVPAL
jgi:predicted esterase